MSFISFLSFIYIEYIYKEINHFFIFYWNFYLINSFLLAQRISFLLNKEKRKSKYYSEDEGNKM